MFHVQGNLDGIGMVSVLVGAETSEEAQASIEACSSCQFLGVVSIAECLPGTQLIAHETFADFESRFSQPEDDSDVMVTEEPESDVSDEVVSEVSTSARAEVADESEDEPESEPEPEPEGDPEVADESEDEPDESGDKDDSDNDDE